MKFQVITNAVEAAIGGGLSVWAGVKLWSYSRAVAWIMLWSGALALFYAVAYFWLYRVLDDPVKIGQWSQFVSKVNYLTWPLVWWIPPLVLVYLFQRERRTREADAAGIVRRAEEIADR